VIGNVSKGLSARLILYNHPREAKTGGDFVLVLTTPKMIADEYTS